MDEEDVLNVLDDLSAILTPVTNTGASRDELAAAVKKALELVEEAYDELALDFDDVDEGEEEVEDDEEDEVEDEDEEPVETEEEEQHA